MTPPRSTFRLDTYYSIVRLRTSEPLKLFVSQENKNGSHRCSRVSRGTRKCLFLGFIKYGIPIALCFWNNGTSFDKRTYMFIKFYEPRKDRVSHRRVNRICQSYLSKSGCIVHLDITESISERHREGWLREREV